MAKSTVPFGKSMIPYNGKNVTNLKKIWLLFGKNSTALNRSHIKNHRKAEKHVKRTTVKFDFFIITQNPVSVSLLLITYRKYSEFIPKKWLDVAVFFKDGSVFFSTWLV